MKTDWLELINDWWVMFWFTSGLAFFVLCIIFAFSDEKDASFGCLGIALACQARCEVKILMKRLELRDGQEPSEMEEERQAKS